MGFFAKLFKSQTETELNVRLPQAVENELLKNSFSDKYRNESSENAVYLLFCDYAGAEKWIRDSAKPESYFNNYIKALQILTEI